MTRDFRFAKDSSLALITVISFEIFSSFQVFCGVNVAILVEVVDNRRSIFHKIFGKVCLVFASLTCKMKGITSFPLLSLLPGAFALNFNRISFFPVCRQLDPSCRTDNETNSEIVTASKDGMTAIYGDSLMGAVGFVDIRDPYHPTPLGYIDVGGETTSVSVVKDYVVVAVNTGSDFVDVAGLLHVIHIPTQSVERTMDLEGQPDSCATSPDERFVAIAIENERDEDLGEGGLPQLPAGYLNVLKTEADDVMDWELSRVELTDLDGLVEPSDPEPEYVDINEENICVVTFQENNGIALVDLETLEVVTSFTAGTVDLVNVDILENEVIEQNGNLEAVPREPDGVTWIGNDYLCTADEGDWNGGSRGFTIFDKTGTVVYSSGEDLERFTTMAGHYPEARAENKGNEPENVEYGEFGGDKLLFVNSERSSLVFVYDVADPTAPIYLQMLPTGLAPEGSKAIPERNLFIVASEEDARGDKVRAGINIYMRSEDEPMYPTLVSTLDDNGHPIPFSALSGLAAAAPYGQVRRKLQTQKRSLKGVARNLFESFVDENADSADMLVEDEGAILYSIEDSFYKKNRIFKIDTSTFPALITQAWRIMDSNNVFADALGEGEMRDSLINSDMTVNIDPEGIAVSQMGGFWLAHEGKLCCCHFGCFLSKRYAGSLMYSSLPLVSYRKGNRWR